MSAKKKAPAKRHERPVTVMAPDYIPSCGIPSEVRVVDLAEQDYAATTEHTRIVRYRQEFHSPEELFVAIAHEGLESAENEHMCKFKNHDELDRAAHVVAEHFLAWVMAQ